MQNIYDLLIFCHHYLDVSIPPGELAMGSATPISSPKRVKNA